MKMTAIEAYNVFDKSARIWFVNDGFPTMYLCVEDLRYIPNDTQIKVMYDGGHFVVKASAKLMKILEHTF